MNRKVVLGVFLTVLGTLLLPHLIVLQLGVGGYLMYRGQLLLPWKFIEIRNVSRDKE